MTADRSPVSPAAAGGPPPALRRAVAADAAVLAAVHADARAGGMPWLPVLHSREETEAWFAYVVLPHQHVTVAEAASRVLGFSAADDGWLQQLYVAPHAQGRGVGRALLRAALDRHPDGLRLHVFARNTRARAFYERAGFVVVGTGDGSGNDEHEPDVTYAHRPG